MRFFGFLNSKNAQQVFGSRSDLSVRFAQDFANNKCKTCGKCSDESWLRHVFEFSEIFKLEFRKGGVF